MAQGKIMRQLVDRDGMTERQADFLEEVIIKVRKKMDDPRTVNVESIINEVLDDFTENK